ncbi:N-formylglutamate amidohydrolase [Evansella sp. AB-rgal1]|uniref:N-formylglutamate amidohydrolase n=1 Tax=Evansella sp. AB-rgal1 TaxID=3242696 RepID=UPI00359E1694
MMVHIKKLPILISVPHGGIEFPENLIGKCLLTKKEILLDSDTWTKDLYHFKDNVEEYVDTNISRLVVDLNRELNDLPPANPDGIVKTLSVVGKQVWDKADGLSKVEIDQLVAMYYRPYHSKLETAALNPNVILGIDCHSMLDVGPSKTQQSWEQRPLFCIGNRGSATGDTLRETITAPPELMLRFKHLLEENFRGIVDEIVGVPLVAINQPFAGGYITRHHGSKGNIPWIQLEINRRLYVPNLQSITLEPTETDIAIITRTRDILLKVFGELVGEEGLPLSG